MSKRRMQDYYRALALAALHRRIIPATAADTAEHMGALAMADGHPKTYWAPIDAHTADGALKTLEGMGHVERGPDMRNQRSGRPIRTWQVTGQRNATYPVPGPTDDDAEPLEAVKPVDPYESMSKQQLFALLRVHDTYAGFFATKLREFAHFADDLQRLAENARRELARVGLEPTE